MTLTIIIVAILAIVIGFRLGWLICYKKYAKEIKSYGEYTKILELVGNKSDLYKFSIKIADDKGDSNPDNDDVEIHIDPIK